MIPLRSLARNPIVGRFACYVTSDNLCVVSDVERTHSKIFSAEERKISDYVWRRAYMIFEVVALHKTHDASREGPRWKKKRQLARCVSIKTPRGQ